MGSTPPPAEKILPNPPVETTPGQISQAYRQDLEDVISKGNRENFLDPASALTEGKLPEGSWPLILSFEFLAKHADFFKEQDEILKTHEDDAVKVSEALDEIRKDVAENVLHGSEAVEKVKQDVEDVKGDVEEIKKTLSKVDEKKELLLNHATTHENAMKLAESRANALDSLVKQLQKRIEVLEQNQGSSKEERSNRVEWDETQLKIKEESKNIERGARKRCSLCDTDSHMLASCPVFPTRQDVAKEIKRRRYCMHCGEKAHPKEICCKFLLTPCDLCLAMGYGRKGMTNHMPEMCVFTSQAPKDNSRRRPADKREIHRSNTDVKKRREASPRSSNFRPTMKHISSSEEIDGGGPNARVLQQIHHRNHAGSSSSFELQGRNQGSSGEGVHQTPDVLKRIQEVQKLLLNMQEDELDQRQMNKGTSYRGQRY